jgi:hypothetical protein
MTSGYEDEAERLAASRRAKPAPLYRTLSEYEDVWDRLSREAFQELARRRRDREQKALLAGLPISGMARA